VPISENLHQVGGLGLPPNGSPRARKAIPAQTMIDWTAALAEWAMPWYTSEKSYFAIRILLVGKAIQMAMMK
jgi:hypothetical protein